MSKSQIPPESVVAWHLAGHFDNLPWGWHKLSSVKGQCFDMAITGIVLSVGCLLAFLAASIMIDLAAVEGYNHC